MIEIAMSAAEEGVELPASEPPPALVTGRLESGVETGRCDPLFLPGWQEFNRLKWGVTPLAVQFGLENSDLPRLDAMLYLNPRGRVVRPPLNPYLAVVFQPTSTTHSFRIASQWMKVAQLFVGKMREFGLSRTLFLPPEIGDVRPWQWAGFRTSVRYTYHLDFPYDLRMADTGVRSRVRRAERLGYVCKRTTDVRAIWECLKATEERQGFDHHLTVEDLELARRCLGDEHLRGYVCYGPQGEPASAAYVLYAPGGKGIGWLHGAKKEHLSDGAVQLLDAFIIKELQESGAIGFDFVGANLPSVATAKSYWGCELIPYYVIEEPGLLAVMRALRAWWRR
ncbi:MAG: GNAT family N-acetyltransferase [Tumebacillaceae bacterium]